MEDGVAVVGKWTIETAEDRRVAAERATVLGKIAQSIFEVDWTPITTEVGVRGWAQLRRRLEAVAIRVEDLTEPWRWPQVQTSPSW